MLQVLRDFKYLNNCLILWRIAPCARRALCRFRLSIRPSFGPTVRLSLLSCPLYKSYTNWRLFYKLDWNAHLNKGDVLNLMLSMGQLKVEVTIEGQISNIQILDIMSCPLCMSYTNWKIFFNLGSNVTLNKGMCRIHVNTLFPALGQGHTWSSNILTCIWIFPKLEKVFA